MSKPEWWVGEEFLKSFAKCWTDYKMFIVKLIDHLDRHFLKNEEVPNLEGRYLGLFKDIYYEKKFKNELLRAVMQ